MTLMKKGALALMMGVMGMSVALANAPATAPKTDATKVTQPAQQKEPFPVKGKVTVVDFGASWCASCPEMAKLFKTLDKKYGKIAAFVTIDIDDYDEIEKKYLIETLPTQIFYDKTGEPIWEHHGSATEEQIMQRVDVLNARDMKGEKIANPPRYADPKTWGKH